MKHVDDNSLVPSRGSGGPLAPWIDAFSDWARQQGYSRSAMSRRVSLATGFDAWLEHEGIDPDHLTSDHPARYLQYRARRQRLYDGDAAALRHLIDFLRLEGVVPAEKTSAGRKSAVERYVLDYERYLRESRGLAPATILRNAELGIKGRDYSDLCRGDTGHEGAGTRQDNTSDRQNRPLPTQRSAARVSGRPVTGDELCRVVGVRPPTQVVRIHAVTVPRIMAPDIVRWAI